ncbi:MAG: hypothetical protein IJC43_01025 [Clostridia bacterium]|nr:hypothetical protein [Clostridia bacterium]
MPKKYRIEPFSLAVARGGAVAAAFLLALSLTLHPYLAQPYTYHNLVRLHTELIHTAALITLASYLSCLLTDWMIKTERARQRKD